MLEIKFNYQFHLEDALAFNEVHRKLNPTRKPKKGYLFSISVFIGLVALILIQYNDSGDARRLWLSLGGVFLFFLLGIFVARQFRKQKMKDQINSHSRHFAEGGNFSAHFTSERLVINTPSGVKEVSWGDIAEIQESAGHFFLVSKERRALAIRKKSVNGINADQLRTFLLNIKAIRKV